MVISITNKKLKWKTHKLLSKDEFPIELGRRFKHSLYDILRIYKIQSQSQSLKHYYSFKKYATGT
jgi:hypothetical protein